MCAAGSDQAWELPGAALRRLTGEGEREREKAVISDPVFASGMDTR